MSFVWTTSWIRCTLRCHIRNAWSLLKPVMEYVGLCMTMFFSFWILWFLFRSHFNFKSPVFLFRLRFLNVALEGLLCYGFTKNTHDIFIPPMFTIWHQRVVPTLNIMIFPFRIGHLGVMKATGGNFTKLWEFGEPLASSPRPQSICLLRVTRTA